ncbi:hypothetical protein PR001_g7167 [Phytophthora rubi]|uniref:RxLR effector protein n=1 Tax=Phytophthora rubi TaxID=129364 RepID=A0A6A3N9J6_9STRA|nr:hypothetical protein PR001_g7167 [Phytophthora rubi]
MVVSVSLLPALLLASWLMSFETDTSLRRHSVLPPESSSRLRLVCEYSAYSTDSTSALLCALRGRFSTERLLAARTAAQTAH